MVTMKPDNGKQWGFTLYARDKELVKACVSALHNDFRGVININKNNK